MTMTLFDVSPHPRHRHIDQPTSVAAAKSISPGRTETLILAIFAGGGTWTDDELCAALPDHYPPTVKTARSRLSRDGLLVDSGVRRPSLRGRDSIVWTLDKGEQ